MPRKKQSTASLELSHDELIHLRDVMSVLLQHNDGQARTVSQLLATLNDNNESESTLWTKVVAECKRLNIPLGDDAHDYAITLMSAPMTVVNIRETT